MKSLCLAFVALVGSAVSAVAQTAALTSDSHSLSAAGGTITLTATVSYEGVPGALGWSIALPSDWSVVSVGGPDIPAIAPDAGTGGTLEFAFTSVPAQRAEFSVVVKYPPKSHTTRATSSALIRAGGKLHTLTPRPLQLVSNPTAESESRN